MLLQFILSVLYVGHLFGPSGQLAAGLVGGLVLGLRGYLRKSLAASGTRWAVRTCWNEVRGTAVNPSVLYYAKDRILMNLRSFS